MLEIMLEIVTHLQEQARALEKNKQKNQHDTDPQLWICFVLGSGIVLGQLKGRENAPPLPSRVPLFTQCDCGFWIWG